MELLLRCMNVIQHVPSICNSAVHGTELMNSSSSISNNNQLKKRKKAANSRCGNFISNKSLLMLIDGSAATGDGCVESSHPK